MSEVLGSFSADSAALYIANRMGVSLLIAQHSSTLPTETVNPMSLV